MDPDRPIGRIVRVKAYDALVELAADTSSYVKSSYAGLHAIAAINSYVIIPVGSLRLVAQVTGLELVEEPPLKSANHDGLSLPHAIRTMAISLLGTISESAGRKQFDYGVKKYPELDNPVWFASKDDLDVIFSTCGVGNATQTSGMVSIGRSPIFPDYQVWIDVDRFFSRHSAVLGSTGSGKSCTVTALIRGVLEQGNAGKMPHAHFIILDTNAEYEAAFTRFSLQDAKKPELLFNRLVIRNEDQTPTGLWVPHWFMDGRDYSAFFRPSEGVQAPLLHRSIAWARSEDENRFPGIHVLDTIERALQMIEDLINNPPTGNSAAYGLADLRDQVKAMESVLEKHEQDFLQLGLTPSYEFYRSRTEVIIQASQSNNSYARITAQIIDFVQPEIDCMREHIASDRRTVESSGIGTQIPRGIDTPSYFDFQDLVNRVFPRELAYEARMNPSVRNWVGSLLLRLEQASRDRRYDFLFRTPQYDKALASFLRLIFGVNPASHFDEPKARPPWANKYSECYPETSEEMLHQVTILDLSRLASDVLENVTALIGRLILEFLQRCPQRGAYPVVLVLEEAHRYIPAHPRDERQQRACEVFERIAKEGRKYGLSLLIASQRPSELSRTVVSQCNSFIIHRVQNPDDRDYFKSVVPDINRDILDQLPALPQQHAIVLGDCIKVPLQVRIKDVSPRPNSHDPQFYAVWSNSASRPPDFEAISAEWEGKSKPAS